MARIKSLFSSDVDVTFGYDTFHVDADGFADVGEETKAHVLNSQPSLWADPDASPVQAQMPVADESTRRPARRPDPNIVRANTPGVAANTPMPPVVESESSVSGGGAAFETAEIREGS